MTRRFLPFTILFAVVMALSGCSGGEATVDAGTDVGTDAGSDAGNLDAGDAGGDVVVDAGLPTELPFEFTRPQVGDPIPPAEVTAFTKKLTGFWKQTQYFNWRLRTSFGYGAGVNICPPDGVSPCMEYALRQDGASMVKSGDLVTFMCNDGAGDNNWIGSSRVLAQAIAAYLFTGDKAAGRVAELYMKGLTATMKGFEYGPNDPNKFIMARAISGNNQQYEFDDIDKDGKPIKRKAAINYTGWRHETKAWNTNTIHDPINPYWGDLWVKDWRSKDDVPHIFRTAAWLQYASDFATDQSIKDAAAEAWYYMQGFSKDIVDSKNESNKGYNIRTKNDKGEAIIPTGDKSDLACFTCFDWIDKNAECTAKLSAALIGYKDKLGNRCDLGFGGAYEITACSQHYYEYAIFRYFHLSALLNALITRENSASLKLLQGFAQRVDQDFATPEDVYAIHGVSKGEWVRDIVVMALAGAAEGLPLTNREASLLQKYYSDSIDEYLNWKNWDIWSMPDGTYDPYRPGGDPSKFIAEEDMAIFMEFCWSPFRNRTTTMPVDCGIIKDPSKW